MRKIDIRQKLEEMGVSQTSISLGDFDAIGKFTAERSRDRNSLFYKTAGAFYRSNYERGILIYYLISKYKLSSMLEIGFGRGYSSICAAKAFYDSGIRGKIVTVDPNFDTDFIKSLYNIFPKQWLDCITFMQGPSKEILPKIDESFDLVYIDGDHSYEGTKYDWEATKDKYKKFLLFDDYHLPGKNDPGIQCQKLIDEIEDDSKELIIMDRRIFFDDRRLNDNEINYGQVLLEKR